LALESEFWDRIVGLVLDAPVIDWTSTLLANVRSSMLPRWIARLGLRILESPRVCEVAGLGTALDLRALDVVARADGLRCPVLVIHSERDRSTPFAVSRRFVDRRPDLARW
jgi:pimeloyl-ACP methyl ester carboxylesterase